MTEAQLIQTKCLVNINVLIYGLINIIQQYSISIQFEIFLFTVCINNCRSACRTIGTFEGFCNQICPNVVSLKIYIRHVL